jgi:L-fucose dehydrogenase
METRTANIQAMLPKIHRSGMVYTDKVVVVTGGAKGIGEGCARVFVDAGARVVILDKDTVAGEALKAELNKKGPGTCHFIAGDASKSKDLKQLITETINLYQTLDCLINNAGMHPPIKTIADFSEDDFIEILKINTIGPFLACQLAIPFLKKSHGSIINIGSLVSAIGQEGATIYAASKAALEGFTKSLAIELGPDSVLVNSILPSNILTNSRKLGVAGLEGGAEYWDRWIDSNQLNGKSGTPEDVGQLCLCLATKVISFMHGASINYSYGAELGYGPKYPFTFLGSMNNQQRWDIVNKPSTPEQKEFQGDIRAKL